jgi:hypothetical protein
VNPVGYYGTKLAIEGLSKLGRGVAGYIGGSSKTNGGPGGLRLNIVQQGPAQGYLGGPYSGYGAGGYAPWDYSTSQQTFSPGTGAGWPETSYQDYLIQGWERL